MPSDLYKHYRRYVAANTRFEKQLVAEHMSHFFESNRHSTAHSDICKAGAAAEMLGRCYFQLEQNTSSEFYFVESFRIFQKLGLEVKAAQVAVQLAMFFLSQDRQQEAAIMLEYYEEQQLKHFGVGHFQSVNASEMRVTVQEKRDCPLSVVAPLNVA